MAIKFAKLCGSLASRTKLDFGRVTKKVTKIHHPGGCVLGGHGTMGPTDVSYGTVPD